MTHTRCLFCCVAMLLIFPNRLLAHAVDGTVAPAQSLCARFLFDDGDPLSYAEVIIRISGEKLPFQKGRTDAAGRFCFYPLKAGTYKIKAADGMGHALELSVKADTGKALGVATPSDHQSTPEWQKALVGISVIFGMFGLIAMLRKRGASG